MITNYQYRENFVGNGDVKLLLYRCSKCEYCTNKMVNLKGHVETFHLEKLLRFKCSQCEYVTSKKRNLKYHF